MGMSVRKLPILPSDVRPFVLVRQGNERHEARCGRKNDKAARSGRIVGVMASYAVAAPLVAARFEATLISLACNGGF